MKDVIDKIDDSVLLETERRYKEIEKNRKKKKRKPVK